jgi:acetyl-CoA synthetase
VTYTELAEATSRFANVLARLGIEPGERVFVLSGRRFELYVAVLGALKARAVACPLFSAFGHEPIRQRMALGEAAVLVTTPELYRRRIAPQRRQLPTLRAVLVAGDEPVDGLDGATSLAPLLADALPTYRIGPTAPEDPALLHFTSGTTGTPKGAIHVHEAVVAHHATARRVLGLGPGDVFWCTADPGWVTGTSYGIVAPLTCRATNLVDEADFEPQRWYRTLAEERVSVWYTAPTAIRLLMRAGDDLAAGVDLRALRVAASVGEPLAADAVEWARRVLGHDIHDTWWQTETGGIMIANQPGAPTRPGAMGTPLPGVEAAVLACDDEGQLRWGPDGGPVVLAGEEVQGMLALKAGWPSMFRGYLHEEARYRRCFAGGWYVSGDLVRRDGAGTYWFVARADDVIKTAGHLIGPFEVERVLLEHPAVADAGAYGVPDPIAGAIVHAAVVLAADIPADPTVERHVLKDVMAHARRRLGAAVAPRRLLRSEVLPKTRSGKVLRRLLGAQELGLPEGDLSTLEPDPPRVPDAAPRADR